MHRRDFIKLLGILGATAALPFKTPNAWAAARPSLPVPGLLRADAAGRIKITIAEGSSFWKQAATRTWGYNGPLLGPAVSVRRGQKVVMEVENALPEFTAVHWHGLEIPGTSDGGPQQRVEPGGLWQPELQIDQPAATCWFHPHPHQKTGRHVAMGLAGLFLIEDDESAKLAIPRNWGADDIPVVLQDKRLNKDGQIDYTVDVVSSAVGWFGDFLLTNGVIYPEHAAPRGWLRMRLLNGCNARSLRLACGDGRPMYVIAGDGGFLAEPVKVNELTMYMGERFEVMVDASDGKAFDLMCLPVKQMGMTLPPFDKPLPALRVMPTEQSGHKSLPDKLTSAPPLPDLTGLPVRKLQLSMDKRLDMRGMRELMSRYGETAMAGMSMDGHAMPGMAGGGGHGGMMDHGDMGSENMSGGHGSMGAGDQQPFDLWRGNLINGKAFTMNTVAFDVKLGQYERWIISGAGDSMLHPFHIHGTRFRILKENGAAPAAHRSGMKDTVFVEGKESEVLVRFMRPAPAERMFMAHCHLLEHEDTGMMLSFTVTG